MNQKTKSNVLVFPLLSKFEDNLPENATDDQKTEYIVKLATHYLKQIIQQLQKHGFSLNVKFFQDYELINQFLISAMMRDIGLFNPLQDQMDRAIAAAIQIERKLSEENKPEE